MFTYEQFYQQPVDVIGRLRQEVEGLLRITDVRSTARGDSVLFAGQLIQDAETVFGALKERFRRLGYTPLLRREGGTDIVVAQRGLSPMARLNPAVNVLLLAATLLTTLWAGASFAGVNALQAWRAAWQTGDLLRLLPVFKIGRAHV